MRRIALAAVIGLALALQPALPAAAAGDTLTIANAASYVVDPVAGGALWVIYTDRPVTQDDKHHNFSPWATVGPGGLAVWATCAGADDIIALPMLYVGPAYEGTQMNLYVPNATGPEPFGTCANFGPRHIWVQPAAGRGPVIERDVTVVAAHPGVFISPSGSEPSGHHIDGLTGAVTPLSQCAAMLPANPSVCRSSTLGEAGQLVLHLTGSEWFVCNPCNGTALMVELARVTNGVVGAYMPLFLGSLLRSSTGVETATVYLSPGTPAGEYRLRVRFNGQPVIPPPLTIELGQPT